MTVQRKGEPDGERGYDDKWVFCKLEEGGKEGWLPLRYLLPVPPKSYCAVCKNLYGASHRLRHCTECDKDVCSQCGEKFILKSETGQKESRYVCTVCSAPLAKQHSPEVDGALQEWDSDSKKKAAGK